MAAPIAAYSPTATCTIISFIAIFDYFDYCGGVSRHNHAGFAMSIALSTAPLAARYEVQAAIQSQRALATYLADGAATQPIQIVDDRNRAHRIELPTKALRLLVDILGELADGNAVQVVPVHAELTTQEAADLLNVSRPYLVKLLEEGALPFHRTGKHRRVRLADLMQYKEARARASEAAMAELTRQSQELAMGYE